MKRYVTSFFFLLCIFTVSVYGLLRPDIKFSELENRNLVLQPNILLKEVLTGEYSKKFESYYNDQLPLRSRFIEANAAFEKNIAGKSIVRSVYVAPTGEMIQPTTNADSRKLNLIVNDINEFSSSLKEKSINVFFALAPDKSTVMNEELPNFYKSKGNELMNLILDGLSEDVKKMDLREVLSTNQGEGLFYYTDHHWNVHGAYNAYVHITKQMHDMYEDISEPLDKGVFDYRVADKPFYGSYARRTTAAYVNKPDQFEYISNIDMKKLRVYVGNDSKKGLYSKNELTNLKLYTNRYAAFLYGDNAEVRIHNKSVNNDHRLLILKDSYANSFVQYITNNIKDTIVLDLRHYNDGDILEYIDKHDIDMVLFLHNINSLVSTPEFTTFQ